MNRIFFFYIFLVCFTNCEIFEKEKKTKSLCFLPYSSIGPSAPEKIQFFNNTKGFISGGGSNNLVFTSDSGVTLTNRSLPTGNLYDYNFLDENNGYATADGLSWYTVDSGINWNQFPTDGARYSQIQFVDSNNGFRSGSIDVRNPDGSFHTDAVFAFTTNGGSSWTRSDPGIRGDTEFFFVDNNFGWVIDSFSHRIIRKSTNGGQTWSTQFYSIDDPNICYWANTCRNFNGLFFLDTNHGWVYGKNTYLVTSNGGATWTEVSNQISKSIIYDLFFLDINTGYARLLFGGGVFKTTDGGNNWVSIQGALKYDISTFFILDENNIWFGDYNSPGKLLNTKDGFATSTSYDVPFTDSFFSFGAFIGDCM